MAWPRTLDKSVPCTLRWEDCHKRETKEKLSRGRPVPCWMVQQLLGCLSLPSATFLFPHCPPLPTPPPRLTATAHIGQPGIKTLSHACIHLTVMVFVPPYVQFKLWPSPWPPKQRGPSWDNQAEMQKEERTSSILWDAAMESSPAPAERCVRREEGTFLCPNWHCAVLDVKLALIPLSFGLTLFVTGEVTQGEALPLFIPLWVIHWYFSSIRLHCFQPI